MSEKVSDRDLYNAVHMQYFQRLQGRPYLSPGEIKIEYPERAHFAFDAAEVAELIFQMPRIGWDAYVFHARPILAHPERAYDLVKFLRKGTTGKIVPVGCIDSVAE